MGQYERPLTFEKVWAMFQETDKKIQETDKSLRRLEDLVTSQWGRLIESLVEGDLVGLLNRYGIAVNAVSERTKGSYQGQNFEFDLVARSIINKPGFVANPFTVPVHRLLFIHRLLFTEKNYRQINGERTKAYTIL